MSDSSTRLPFDGLCSVVILSVILCLPLAPAFGARLAENFNSGWRYARGEQDAAVAAPSFDDSGWAEVRVPHDWAIAGPFDENASGYAGKLPWKGVGWYRKSFELDRDLEGMKVLLDFDGVMAFARVYVNGHLAGEWDYGYTSFRVDATPYLVFGDRNVIAVRADTENWGTRWYPGAGIYRKVTLVSCDPVHLAHWGTSVTTPIITGDFAEVRIRTTVDNETNFDTERFVDLEVTDPDGSVVARGISNASVPAGESKTVEQLFRVAKPQKWDVSTPNLYQVKTTIREPNGAIGEEAAVSFGIRTFEFTADAGFILNGRRVQLRGANLHHDQGPLGAAFNVRAMERQLEIMQEMGVNAIRTSHNPPAPELLDLCDRMGIVVWDEAFDKWDGTAGRHDGLPPLREFGERHIRSLVLRDRNHPSVVVWSVGNEIPPGGEGVTPERVAFLSEFVRRYDPTRPVAMGCDRPGMANQPNFDALDLTGWNYGRRYATMRERYPEKPIVYSESASALSTRGFYELPLPKDKTDYSKKDQVDSYDLNSAPWSDIPDKEFQLMEQDRFVAGEFVWTGFDYLGEPTPFTEVARSSYFGVVDLCGIPKDRYYLYRSYWRPDVNTVHILPHWNWPDRVGQEVPVFVYTNGDSAELFLNGKSLGRRTKGVVPEQSSNRAIGAAGTTSSNSSSDYYDVTYRYRLRWNHVIYEPGELKVVAYRNGRPVGEAVVHTAGSPAAIRLTPDRDRLEASGDDLCYTLVEAFDESGNPCPLADNLVHFELEGPAEIAGVGNGNPLSLEPFQASYRKLFNGKAMLILRTRDGEAGRISIRARSQGLKDGLAAVAAE